MLSKIKSETLYKANVIVSAILIVFLIVIIQFGMGVRPGRISHLHTEIAKLQEKLISAQITSQRLFYVQRLIENNMALSSRDTLAQGASISFLKDLTAVLDKLRITLISLEPQPVSSKLQYIETPYKMEIICNYNQFTQLVNKMEKSPRLISIKSFEIKNDMNNYFSNDHKEKLDQCQMTLNITTLTLIKKPS